MLYRAHYLVLLIVTVQWAFSAMCDEMFVAFVQLTKRMEKLQNNDTSDNVVEPTAK